jgi:hypothetical protein
VKASIPIAYCKRRLATVWFSGAGVVFFMVLLQSLLGHFGDQVSQAWGWLLPTVLPTLSLIIGVLVYDTVEQADVGKTADRFLFRLTVGLSSVYLLAVFLVVALQPLASELTSLGPIQVMMQTNVWLGPLQGLVAAAMGAFFVKAAHKSQFVDAAESPGSEGSDR